METHKKEKIFPGSIRRLQIGDMTQIEPILRFWMVDSKSGEFDEKDFNNTSSEMRKSILGLNDREYFVAEIDQQVVGIMGYRNPEEGMKQFISQGKTGKEIINAYINKRFQGNGVGTTLLKTIIDELKSQRIDEAVVSSGPRFKESGWTFWHKMFGMAVKILPDYYGPNTPTPVWKTKLS